MSVLALRPIALAALSAVAGAGLASSSASAAPAVQLSVSTSYAVIGFPVTVSVTSTEPGTASLVQVRPDRALGPGRCSGYNTRTVANTTRPIAAGQKLTYSIQPAALFYGAGSPVAPIGWDNPNAPGYQDQCWDRYTQFNQLRAEVTQGAPTYGFGSATKPLTRIL